MKNTNMIEIVGFDKYFEGQTWEQANKSFFDQLAKKYDWLNQVISLGQQKAYKRQVIEDLKLSSGMRVLDICTGTGDMALLMAEKTPHLCIDAIDVSAAMLKIAEQKASRLKSGQIRFQIADALALPFNDNSFDALVMSFGLRNFSDIRLGLKEAYRVLKPHGRFVCLDLGKPKGWRKVLYYLYYENLMPWLGKVLFHRGEYNSFFYLSTSNKYFPDPSSIKVMMRQGGFKNIQNKEYMFGGLAQYIAQK